MKSAATGLREKIRSCQLTLGSWIQTGHPAVLEYMADYPFDWLAVDLEHSDINIDTFTNMLRGRGSREIGLLARVKKNAPLDIRQVLDVGADGVIVPLVNSAREAEEAVASAKYAPEGNRGFAFCRANGYGRKFSEYGKRANGQSIVIIMIESITAVDDIDAILSVDGLDGVLIGPYDLSGSLGIPGKTDDPAIQNAIAKVLASCKKLGKAGGIHQVNPDPQMLQNHVEKGFRFIAVGMDNVFLGKGIESVLEDRGVKQLLNEHREGEGK